MGEYARLSNDEALGSFFNSNDCFYDSYKAFDPNYSPVTISIIEIKKETEKAWFITTPLKSGVNGDLWFPKKQCKIKNGELFMPKWLFNLKNKELNVKRPAAQ